MDILQIFLNMWLNPQTADQYSHGYSHIEHYFDSFANEKTIKATLKNNLFLINIGLISIKSCVILGNFKYINILNIQIYNFKYKIT